MKQSNMLMLVVGVVVVAVVGLFLFNSMGSSENAVMENENEMTTMDESESQVAPTQNIVEVAQGAGTFTTLLAAAEAAGLVPTLTGEGPFTVFAPSDEAFEKLPAGTVEALLEDTEQLTQILTYHVVPGKVMASDVVNLTSATTVEGSDVAIKVEGNTVMVNDSTVIATDIEASNGVIHVIDTVLMP